MLHRKEHSGRARVPAQTNRGGDLNPPHFQLCKWMIGRRPGIPHYRPSFQRGPPRHTCRELVPPAGGLHALSRVGGLMGDKHRPTKGRVPMRGRVHEPHPRSLTPPGEPSSCCPRSPNVHSPPPQGSLTEGISAWGGSHLQVMSTDL